MALWNFTLDDTSTFFNYREFTSTLSKPHFLTSQVPLLEADGSNSGLSNGWVPWYSDSGYLSSNGQGGSGTSYHRTSRSGASVSLTFHGTAVELYGISNGSYNVTLDNSPYQPQGITLIDGLLASISNLIEGIHTVTLAAAPTSPSQQLAFDGAVVFTPLVNDQVPTEAFYDNTDKTMLQYTGNWSSATAPDIPNATVTHPWQETFSAGASVSMDIALGAVGLSLHGLADWGNWLYTSLDGGPTNTYNCSTFWKVPDALLYFQGGLDPSKNHTITLTNMNDGMKLALNSMRLYRINVDAAAPATSASTSVPGSGSVSSSTPPSASSTSRISAQHSSVKAGIIAGPIVAVVLLAFACICYSWWRRQSRPSRHTLLPIIAIPHTIPDMAGVTPYSIHSSTIPTPSRESSDGRSLPAKTRRKPSSRAPPSPPPPPPPPPQPAPAPAPAPPSGPDIDLIIELIAQRIDRARGHGVDSSAPPEYSD
ncbi:hypothetical protein FB45DRAFT_1066100 [Roridomyces roridus]|uniref:Transmembrane protein n=1 Tax=Roridomyces roridus TaxID=1738132 RepID=A0AAD7F9Q9_9AGAR|nr:hypothetical protein FB45DRAFT_1066100 [Roridomyces roridus]